MLSQKLLYRFATLRIQEEIKATYTLSENYCKHCQKEFNTYNTLSRHEAKCKEPSAHLNQYNCICSNKKYLSQETRIEHENSCCNDEIISELIIEEDWLKMLSYYNNAYVKDLKSEYKSAFSKVIHLRNKPLLVLLNKISNESHRFRTYLNSDDEHPSCYWSRLTLRDFQIIDN